MKLKIAVKRNNSDKPFLTFEQQLMPKIGSELIHPRIKEKAKIIAIEQDVKKSNYLIVTVN